MNRVLHFILIIAALLLMSGCFNAGIFPSANVTDVRLGSANYEIVAKNVAGESEAGYLFGLSFANGMNSGTLALVRVSGTGMIYQEALEKLWADYEGRHGPIEGKKLALVNVRYDADVVNAFIYTSTKISVRADVVEFTD